ncbi:hypothetical protein HF086_013853 [Spodoptera exigua]|uniref:Bromo domain-containing protein n=1 Tax=Spodoptera exigua TaxID=7107 RepID=A0A922MG00_SPOEX|nr:hypothetical protein HF086_013853 [Spodoptera exigua]
MDDLENITCKEELEASDVENSATDDHKEIEEKPNLKRKRRRREIDMIKLSDDDDSDDEGLAKKLIRRLSPGPGPISPASHREPRTCVLKSDFKLMCNNAMKYNKPGTVYHKAARRLLHAGLKQLTPQKLRPLGNLLTYMYEIPIKELGFDIGKMDVDLSKVKVDIDQLRTLSELGIDVEYLNDIEEEVAASQHDYGIGGALRHTTDLLAKLEKEQRDRLSAPAPWHLSLSARPGAAERELARLVAACLRAMLARVPPRHVAPVPALRAAMGVTLDHLDTPMAVDDFEMEMNEHRDVASDPDSRSSHDK